MPQADLTTFAPTLLFLPLTFLGGYFFFVTHWVPRLLLTFKARDWLVTYSVGVTLPEGSSWPELFLMTLQFGGLVYLVSRLALTGPVGPGLTPLVYVAPPRATLVRAGGAGVENFFHTWLLHRGHLFFAPAGGALTGVVQASLGSFPFFSPSRQFPLLGVRLRRRLSLNGEGHSSVA